MKETVVFLIASYLAALYQTSIGTFLQTGYIRLDAIAAIICWYGLRRHTFEGILPVFFTGLMAAQFSVVPWFVFPFSYLVAFFTVRYIISNILEVAWIHVVLITGFISMEICVIQLVGSKNPELVWPWGVFQALLNGISAPFFLSFCNRFYSGIEKIGSRKGEVSSE